MSGNTSNSIMYLLRSVIFPTLTTLAILLLPDLTSNNCESTKTGKIESINLITDLIAVDIVLPPATHHNSLGYKLWKYTFELHKVRVPDHFGIVSFSSIYPFSDSIINYSLLIIYPFHSFW